MHHLPFPVFDGFTASASLSLSTDGPIDPHLSALAHAYDMARIGTAPTPARIGKVTLKPAAIVSIMAAAIEKAAVRSGTVHRADFLQLGLRNDEIERHYQEAFRRAAFRHPSLYAMEAA